MGAEPELIQLYDLPFSDLRRLSTSHDDAAFQCPSDGDCSRLECVSASVMEALGPSGPGLLSVSGVPSASSLRRSLLPLALNLSLLHPRDRASLLKVYLLLFLLSFLKQKTTTAIRRRTFYFLRSSGIYVLFDFRNMDWAVMCR